MKQTTMKDLTKILKTGDKVYCVLTGKYETVEEIGTNLLYPIGVDDKTFTEFGQLYDGYPNSECLIWPSKEERSWDNYPKFKKGDLVLMWDNGSLSRSPDIYFGEDPNGGHFAASYIHGKLHRAESFDNCERFTPEMLEKAIEV